MPAHLEDVDLNQVESNNVIALQDTQFRRMSVAVPHLDELTADAARATKNEHHMTLMQGLRTYPKAVGWSMLISLAIVMEGFDLILLNNLFAYDEFNKQFGKLQPDGSYQVSAAWQSGLSNGALVGEILGLFVTGIIAERYGYRKTIMGALCLVVCFVFIVFFSKSITQLLIGEILLGIPWGVFQTITTTYAAEVCPVALRAYLTTYVNLCWVFGQLIASGVLRGVITRHDQWGYRIPFALQWLWPIPICIGVYFAPESPWWLVRKERVEDAKHALLRLTSPERDPNFDPDATISMIVHTNEMEKAVSAGTSYWDCFKGVDFRRTEIVTFVWAVQTLCGASLMGYSTYFYEQAGMAETNAFTMSMAQFAIGAIGTMSSWALMRWFGRRTLYMWGQLIMTLVLLIIGFLGLISHSNSSAQWAVGSMLLIYTFTYDATVGPVCYSLVSELSSTRLRAKTIVLARNLYNITGIAINVITPRMLNPTAWNWGAKSGFFFAGTCFLCFLWTFFRLPEPKGRTYAELDLLFEQRVPARKFKTTIVDPFMTKTVRRASVASGVAWPDQKTIAEYDEKALALERTQT
jgi:MFS transporter, SP family, general alpha glucoside:H+ symporter